MKIKECRLFGIAILLLLMIGTCTCAASEGEVDIRLIGNYSQGSGEIDAFNGYAYISDYNHLYIVDVSDSSDPNLTSSSSYNAYSTAVLSDDYIYMADPLVDGLRVLDISNKSNPNTTSTLGGYTYSYPNSKINIEAQDTSVFLRDRFGINVINVSDPTHPSAVYTIGTSSH
ncbi:hypothetical protein [Methanococcoides seepicolus]|uniref:LVIVD repeat protein n=1 Tax=Methanococcoides seepicolus TaxID=2828780 RepID=A0A9E4ZG16_9EURY|nr:hypothetical protein [Methanococcoides seepicolus]MCM1987047.1 hypothetical protein [Methanococcoides seepicolus]